MRNRVINALIELGLPANKKNKNRLGILEEDRPNETAKKAFRHKPYQNDFKRRDADGKKNGRK